MKQNISHSLRDSVTFTSDIAMRMSFIPERVWKEGERRREEGGGRREKGEGRREERGGRREKK